MKKFAREALMIPNILSWLRLALIPVFATAYLKGDISRAMLAIALSAFSDIIDGRLARRLGQVTDLGKILDPVADKLTEGTMIICLALRCRAALILFGLMAVKEAGMAYMGFKTMRLNAGVHSARWYGKVCTVCLYASLTLLLLLPDAPYWFNITLLSFCGIVVVMTLALYVNWYRGIWVRQARIDAAAQKAEY